MIFESIAGITSALSIVIGMVSAAKETGGNVTGVLGKMGEIQDGIHRFELEKREASIPTQRLTPAEAFALAEKKRAVARYFEDVKLLCMMSTEGAKLWDEFERTMKESREQHARDVKLLIARQKARKAFLHDLMVWSVVGFCGLIIAGVVIALVIAIFKP